MIRTIVTPEQQDVFIRLPQNFVGKKVEVIAFTIDEATDKTIKSDIPLTYLASEKVLAKDWQTAEEDTAWQNL